MDELVAQVNHDEPPPRSRESAGWVEVIAGSMFSGKSEELIRRLRRAKIARQKVQVFKPEIDSRFSESQIVSHSEMRHDSANSRSAAEVLAKVDPDTEVVGIDEGQFFDNELVEVANTLARRGVRVIIAGLDQDYTGKPWEPMPQLLAIAEYITKTHAICMKCGQPANYSQRTFESEERVAVGASDMPKPSNTFPPVNFSNVSLVSFINAAEPDMQALMEDKSYLPAFTSG